jgi:predicted nucleic acid-binding protein
MIVVSDTSPLNYLILIQQIELLNKLFGEVVIPQAVARELANPATPSVVRQFMDKPPKWLSIVHVRLLDPTLPRLGAGETEAITLALELHADLLLCDDADARRAAAARSIRITGTLGVIELGAIQGHVDFPTCIERLRKTTLRMPESLVARMLRDDAARNRP